ncbi:MAG: hypothetical protein BGO69_03195 [Bacteroidetes bacterium 46-16]|jgi:hypothetical protein|nr:MAG: hypothetical protein BGO69_03195 [Bacteroidetes bacterium 46-16]
MSLEGNLETFFNALEDILSDTLYVTDQTDDVQKEISENCWALGIPRGIDIEVLMSFFQKVKENRKAQLILSDIEVDLIFYLWYDEQACQLRFNLINTNHRELPFKCALDIVDNERTVIEQAFKTEDETPDIDLDKNETTLVLKVYRTTLTK